MTGFVRTQSYVDGDVILAEHSNDEFDLLQDVFDASMGHNHDGSTGGGALIQKVSDKDGDTYITTESNPDDDTITMYSAGNKVMSVDSLGLLLGDRFRLTYDPVLDSLNIYVE